jgi:hypothetical protein
MPARRFILFVLTIFVLQLSWVAVAAYCEHETGRAARHFGHHSPESALQKAAGDGEDQTSSLAKKASPHSHCSSCAHTPLSFDGLPVALSMAAQIRHASPATPPRSPSPYPARPERPQWISAV